MRVGGSRTTQRSAHDGHSVNRAGRSLQLLVDPGHDEAPAIENFGCSARRKACLSRWQPCRRVDHPPPTSGGCSQVVKGWIVGVSGRSAIIIQIFASLIQRRLRPDALDKVRIGENHLTEGLDVG